MSSNGNARSVVSLQGLRVLVVEDEPMVRMLLEDMLADLGCVVAATAGRLEEALDLARTAVCDLAILDLNLAGKTTWEVAETLHRRAVPFVVASGDHTPRAPAAFGPVLVLPKPFVDHQLASILGRALERRTTG